MLPGGTDDDGTCDLSFIAAPWREISPVSLPNPHLAGYSNLRKHFSGEAGLIRHLEGKTLTPDMHRCMSFCFVFIPEPDPWAQWHQRSKGPQGT